MKIKGDNGLALLLGLAVVTVTSLVAIQDSDSAVRGWIERSDSDYETQGEAGEAGEPEGEDAFPEEEFATDEAGVEENTNQDFSTDKVARPTFTSDVVDREPVDNLEHLPLEADRVFFFTELRNMDGQTAIHRWEYGGDIIADVEFDVGGPRWRVWSSKSLQPQWAGTWTVSVMNTAGDVLGRASIEYGASEP